MKRLLFVTAAVLAAIAVMAALSIKIAETAAIAEAREHALPGAEVKASDVNFRQLSFIVKGTATGDQYRNWIYVYALGLNKSAFAIGETADEWLANAASRKGAEMAASHE